MPSDNPIDSKKQFVSDIKDSYMAELAKLEGVCDSWSLRRPIIALSGGPDSTALILAMHSFCTELGVKVRPCHINHKLRGEESDKDAQFASNLCESLGLALEIREVSLNMDSNPSEDKLRKVRYKELLDYAQSIDSSIVLTGHTLDDQLETILFRLFRGTSQSGLTGIKTTRELKEDSSVFLVRPMLETSKIDCLKFLVESEATARQDSSNNEVNFDRNYIRHQIIPRIETRFSQWRRSLVRLRDLIVSEEDYFDKEIADLKRNIVIESTDELVRLNIEKMRGLHVALQRRLVASILRQLGNEPSYERVFQVLGLIAEGSEEVAHTLSVQLEARILDQCLVFKLLDDESLDERLEYLSRQVTKLNLPDVLGERQSTTNIIAWLNKSLRITRWQREEFTDDKEFPKQRDLVALVNLTGVKQPLVVRMRQPKDIIQPFGMKEKVKLKKYLHTHKTSDQSQIPSFQAELSTVIVVADEDEILWVPGFGISEKLRVIGDPTHQLTLLDLSSGGVSFA